MNDARWILLLRHAHAESTAPGQDDHSRNLSALGEAESDAAAAFLAGFTELPPLQRVLCSTAERTRQTTARLLARLGYVDTRHEARIYNATAGELIDVLDEHADAGVVLLVGHNPGLEHLSALLSSGRSGDYRGMPPASLAILRLPAGQPIEPGQAELVRFWSP